MRVAAALAVGAPAKLNLRLRVVSRRPNGMHEVVTRLQAISLHDLVMIEPAASTSLAGGFGGDDLALRALREVESALGLSLPSRIRLVKRIPAGAGLGGGSSDAAAVIRALVRLHGLDIPFADLARVAGRVGADVPFFLTGGAATATGPGTELVQEAPQTGCFALAWPGWQLSTAAVYATWDEVGGEGPNELARAAVRVEPRLTAFAAGLGPGWRMTGSGSGFFRPCSTRREGEAAIAGLSCWKAVAVPLSAWEP